MKYRNTVIQNWTEKCSLLVLVHSTWVQDYGLHLYQLILQGRALALRGQNRLEGTSGRSQEGQTGENSRCVKATTDTSELQANNPLWMVKMTGWRSTPSAKAEIHQNTNWGISGSVGIHSQDIISPGKGLQVHVLSPWAVRCNLTQLSLQCWRHTP